MTAADDAKAISDEERAAMVELALIGLPFPKGHWLGANIIAMDARLTAAEAALARVTAEQHDEIRRATELQDRYNREVLGLNNEGDAIGGEPPCGLKHQVEYLRAERDRLAAAARRVVEGAKLTAAGWLLDGDAVQALDQESAS